MTLTKPHTRTPGRHRPGTYPHMPTVAELRAGITGEKHERGPGGNHRTGQRAPDAITRVESENTTLLPRAGDLCDDAKTVELLRVDDFTPLFLALDERNLQPFLDTTFQSVQCEFCQNEGALTCVRVTWRDDTDTGGDLTEACAGCAVVALEWAEQKTDRDVKVDIAGPAGAVLIGGAL